MYDVITVGSSTIDVFAKVDSELIKIKTAHHEEELIAYPCGSKILIRELNFLIGGGGTNTAVSLSRLGLKVAYLGKMSQGSNTGLIMDCLKKEKIDFIGSKSKKFHSGYSIILDSIEGDRTILAYKGANNYLDFKELNLKKLKTKWFYFSSMMNKSYETLEKLAIYAKENNIKIAFNPSNYLAEKGYLYLKEIIQRTDLLILNKEEATLLGGKISIKELIIKIMNFGAKSVIITNGKDGAYTISNNKLYQVLASNIKPKETTGAGDAFASTFLAAKIKGKSIETCLKMACKNSESVIMNDGAKNGLMKYSTLLSSLKKDAPKIKKTVIKSGIKTY